MSAAGQVRRDRSRSAPPRRSRLGPRAPGRRGRRQGRRRTGQLSVSPERAIAPRTKKAEPAVAVRGDDVVTANGPGVLASAGVAAAPPASIEPPERAITATAARKRPARPDARARTPRASAFTCIRNMAFLNTVPSHSPGPGPHGAGLLAPAHRAFARGRQPPRSPWAPGWVFAA